MHPRAFSHRELSAAPENCRVEPAFGINPNGLAFADFALEDMDAERLRISLVNDNAFSARRG
jgi:hypothetical protein